MTEAKLAPNLPDWQLQHANRYIASGGTEGHMYKVDVPGRGEITAPALLLTTTGRKSGEKYIFPLFYGTDGGSYIVVASKGRGARTPWVVPQSPRQPGCRGASRDQEAESARQDSNGRRTGATLEKGARVLAALCRLCAQDRTRNSGSRIGPHSLICGDATIRRMELVAARPRGGRSSRSDCLRPSEISPTGRTEAPLHQLARLRSPCRRPFAPHRAPVSTCVRRPRQGRCASGA